jgi:peptide/nickel transport system substrate-binding protein
MQRLSATAFLLLVFACAGEERPAPRAAASAPRDGGRLIRRLESDVNTLNFLLHTTDYERYVLDYLYDPIVGVDPDVQPVPAAAKSWEVSPDGKTYTFHLDPAGTFSDGTRVTARDLVFTLEKLLDEQSQQFATWFEHLDRKQTRPADDLTAVVVFKEARPGQLFAFNIAILPEHVYAKGNFKNDYNDTAVGNGPYRLARREKGTSVLLERRADYKGVRPRIDSVLFKVVNDHAVALQAVRRGDIDETRVPLDLWYLQKDTLAKDVNFRQTFRLAYSCIMWNERHPVLAQKTVRRALAMAYDRPHIIESLYHGAARPMTGPFTPDQWARDPDVKPIDYDPAGARRLLEADGWRDADGDGVLEKDGRPLAFEVAFPAGDTIGTSQSQLFQAALRKIGVDMRIRTMDGATFFDRVMQGEFEAAMMAWSLDPDPDVYPLFHSSQFPPGGMNIVHYRNPALDGLIDASRREMDPRKRAELFHRIHRTLADDQPYLWTVQVASTWAIRKRVHGVGESKGLGLFFWWPGPRSWWLD